jgi:SPOR domain
MATIQPGAAPPSGVLRFLRLLFVSHRVRLYTYVMEGQTLGDSPVTDRRLMAVLARAILVCMEASTRVVQAARFRAASPVALIQTQPITLAEQNNKGSSNTSLPIRHRKGYRILIRAVMDTTVAAKMRSRLQHLGNPSHPVSTTIARQRRYRVDVGPYATQEEATKAEAELEILCNLRRGWAKRPCGPLSPSVRNQQNASRRNSLRERRRFYKPESTEFVERSHIGRWTNKHEVGSTHLSA